MPDLRGWAVRILALAFICNKAYDIRLHAIREYGLIIHEFDPWFNYRATEYLHEHGLDKFFKWYDYMSWYPLGRPVGTTIYPGMQMTSVAIYNVLEALGIPMLLNDICCYVPAWFGVSATIALGMLTYECSKNVNAAVVATAIMSIIPAHIMRSVGGGYDNESIAMTAMLTTFYLWNRSLRSDSSWAFGILAGLAYVYMVAAWGGYVFVLNMIGLHAAALAALNLLKERSNSKLHRAYTLFYIIGTYGAIQVPVVGWTPLKSLEQLPAFFVLLGLQLLEVLQVVVKQKKLEGVEALKFRARVVAMAMGVGLLVIMLFVPRGYFGPLSSRVRGLFVKHTKTGNPLVDSVAEHQPASSDAYYQNLHFVYYLAPIGFFVAAKKMEEDSSVFLVLYGLVAYYFSSKMARLIILLGPIASALGGIAAVSIYGWVKEQLILGMKWYGLDEEEEEKEVPTGDIDIKAKLEGKKKKKPEKKKNTKDMGLQETLEEMYNGKELRMSRVMTAVFLVVYTIVTVPSFYFYSHRMAEAMSHPSLLFKATLTSGEEVMVDDYREAYWWLRDNTPADARVMAWWDYGYQIAGIANRTSIADGNTWNHEHIATLGKCLISPEKKAHKMIKHIADYVLVWTGGGGDDLAKSTHIARIANSVYKDMCGEKDPLCRKFGFTENGPTKMMSESLIYKLHSHAKKEGVVVNKKYFQHMFESKFGKVRIYRVMNVNKESKAWVADPANRECDAPGSWYCTGKYPPAMDFIFKKRKDFKQLEDFNVEDDAEAAKYRAEYMKNIRGRN